MGKLQKPMIFESKVSADPFERTVQLGNTAERLGAVAEEIDHVPSLVWVQDSGKAGHHALVHPVADPPEEIPGAVREEMRFGQIGRPDRQGDAGGL